MATAPAKTIPQNPPNPSADPEQRAAQTAATGERPDVASNIMPIAQQAQQAAQPKPGVPETQMGQAPKAKLTEGPSKKRAILSVLGAAAGLGPMVQQINQKHNQDQLLRNQHIIDTVWQSHKNETEARNRVQQLQPIVQDLEAKMKEAQALPDSDPTKIGRMGYLAHLHQQVVAEVVQAAQTVQASQQNLQAILGDPKNRKIVSKAVGYDEKFANSPERQQMIAAIRKSVPGTSPEEAQVESQFPQGPSRGQPALDPRVQEQVLKSATEQAKQEGKVAQPPKETSDSRARADYEEWKKQHPEWTGTFEEWKPTMAAKGRQSGNRDDRYIAIEQKKAEGQPLTPDEQAYQAAYDIWTQKTKVAPGVARAAAYSANRYIPVLDPSDPENVTFMRAGDAARTGASSPQSISFQTDKAITRYMTSGQGGQNITNFNTAVQHLDLLKEAGAALQNGDVQLFNRLGNRYATETGMPAPTNFDAVKMAVAGELSKTFKGAGATDAEISQINSTLSTAQSPQQIQGAIDYYSRLMNSKIEALQGQYQAGKSGKPAFHEPSSGSPLQHKVGDVVMVGGQKVKITKIDANGKATGVPVP